MVSHITAKFGGEKHRGSGYIMVLVCHAISQNYVTKALISIMGRSSVMGKSPLRLVTILPSLVRLGTRLVKL